MKLTKAQEKLIADTKRMIKQKPRNRLEAFCLALMEVALKRIESARKEK